MSDTDESDGDAEKEDVEEAWKRRPNKDVLEELKRTWLRRNRQIWDGPEERYWLRVRDPEDEVNNFGAIIPESGNVNGIRKISPLAAYKLIDTNLNPLTDYTSRNRDGSFNIMVPRNEVMLALCVTQIGQTNVTVEKHPFKNKCRGTVHTWDSVKMPECEILNALQDYRVVKVVKKKYTNKATKSREYSGELLLTFDSDTLPTEIKLGWLPLKPQQHKPKPLQCTKCFRYGNQCFEFEPTFKVKCTGSEKCGWCGEEPHLAEGERCDRNQNCIQCRGNHPSWNKECPAYLSECQILEKKETHKVSYNHAKKIVDTQKSGSRGAPTTAQVVMANQNSYQHHHQIENKLEELLEQSNRAWEARFDALQTTVERFMAKMELTQTAISRFMMSSNQQMTVIPPVEVNSVYSTPSRHYQESMIRSNHDNRDEEENKMEVTDSLSSVTDKQEIKKSAETKRLIENPYNGDKVRGPIYSSLTPQEREQYKTMKKPEQKLWWEARLGKGHTPKKKKK